MNWLEVLYSMVKNIIIYLIMMTVIMNLIGNSSFKKYIQIFSGIILIIIVVLPIINIFKASDKLSYYFNLNELQVNTNEMKNQILETDEGQSKTIISDYKKGLKTEINTKLTVHNLTATSIELVIEEDTKSSKYGTLEALKIVAHYLGSEDLKKETKSTIDNVVIDKISINKEKEFNAEDNNKSKNGSGDSLVELNVSKELAAFYNINPESITVEISEE